MELRFQPHKSDGDKLSCRLTQDIVSHMFRSSRAVFTGFNRFMEAKMKVRNSLKSLRDRHQKNQVVRRRGRLYVINKVNKRFKARQG